MPGAAGARPHSPAVPTRANATRMATPDPDDHARRRLRRAKAFATALLAATGGLVVLSYALPPGWPAELLQSAAKAGLVGGLADWFAVTALFRHPLGLPVPHTAIIPAQKARLGAALGRFVASHVVTEEEVSRALARLDVPDLVRRFLADPQTIEPLARALATAVPGLFTTLEDGSVGRVAGRVASRLLGGSGASLVLARALHGLVDGGRHQEVLGFLLEQLRGALAAKQDQLRRMIEERVSEQGGRVVGWAIGASIATRVLTSINAELDKVDPQNSEIRAAFDEWVRREIVRMEEDPGRAAEIGRILRDVVRHETVQNWAGDVWQRLRRTIEADAARPDGHTVDVLEAGLVRLSGVLTEGPQAQARLRRGADALVARMLPLVQDQLAGFISDVVANWDTDTLVNRIELRVGPDLQYVRVNGTLVGFLAGGVLYAILRVVFGHVVS